jgi:photosystem II stability/assembly factor-like uncharacterized protein
MVEEETRTVAGADCCIVYKSTDGGAIWTERGNVMANAFRVTDPVTPATLYAGGDFGIFKSIDDGSNWIPAGPAAHALVIDPLTPATLYATRTDYNCFEFWGDFQCLVTGVIYKSTDAATNWTQVAELADIPVYPVVIDPLTPTTLYASGWKSTDGGATWSTDVRSG